MTWQDRFLEKVARRADNKCWLWRAAVNRSGYGRFAVSFGAPQRMATHVMLELMGRPRPSPESQALHTCDTPRRVNPHHLYWGGYAENTADKVARGRVVGEQITGAKNGMNTKPESRMRGEKNANAVLTEAQVRAILKDTRKNTVIASEYGVSSALIGQIKRGSAWKHVPREAK